MTRKWTRTDALHAAGIIRRVQTPKVDTQPRTGARCTCKRGVMRDNCSTCEATGWVIDFARIRARISK